MASGNSLSEAAALIYLVLLYFNLLVLTRPSIVVFIRIYTCVKYRACKGYG